MFLDNSIESDDLKAQVRGMDHVDGFGPGSVMPSELRNNAEFNDYASQLLRIQRNNMSPRIFFETIRMRSKNVFFHGAIMAFFIICVITTFVIGVYGFSLMAGANDNVDSAVSTSPYDDDSGSF